MTAYKSSTSLGDGEEKGIRSSTGIQDADAAEQQAVQDSLRKMKSGQGDPDSSTLFEEDFAAKHGIRFRSDPPDSIQFEYGSDGLVIVRNMQAATVEGDAVAGAAADMHPFQLTDATEAGTEKVNVRFGMVNAITPTVMDPVDGQTITVTSDGYVVLTVTTDVDGIATSAVITVEASVPADTDTEGHIALGYVTAGTDVVTCSQSVSGSLWHQMCGAETHLFGSV